MYCSTRPLRSAAHFLKASWKSNHVSFRALISCSHKDYEDDFIQPSLQNVSQNQNLSENVDIQFLVQLLRNGSPPTPHILSKTISACAKSGLLDLGIQVHSAIVKLGFSLNPYISSALVDMYGKCWSMSNAQKVFDEMQCPNVVTWNSLVTGYLQAGCPLMAITWFLEMLKQGIEPTPFSLSGVLVGCSQLQAGKLGTQLHGVSLKLRFSSNVVVGTGLIDMYSKCCNLEDSRRVFDIMSDKNVFTWTSMITGYARNQQPHEAMVLMREMLHLDLKPNYMTYNSLLSSFSCPHHFDQCKQIHCRVIAQGFESHNYIAATLVTAYSECCSSLEDYRKVCSNITISDQISWNAVLAGFSNLGIGEEALECFIQMRRENVDVDFFTFTSIFRAIGIGSALEEGKQIHGLVYKTGYGLNLFVQNGLVSMYARCGAIRDSKKVFSRMNEHDLISWNSLLSGCAYHGCGEEVIDLFEQMRRTSVKPDDTSFLAVLTACSHVGLLDKGLEYFNLMRNRLLEPPKLEHYATVVDLFGRAGNLHEAEAFIENIPIEPGISIYKALLSACLVHGNKDIAIRTAKKLLELYPHDSATYIMLSNVLGRDGYWDDAAGIRRLMSNRGVKKNPGFSWM
ncbi:pentatricopeptide repeat-containing protein At1g11290, chloroplastic-like [Cucurbita moschata]|uniref:Pentatricopeptide repeat-containing protein At1g11290, chloroplastic-like n=1 Tax=Cucurbita moschata TaxID=3662 RepID=A0A6J1FYL3_CUCMO|nr:pentatricopeptide repeat-containing protein At1g11290, chloroplastic-like [Cucurbita moschata]